LSFPVGLQVLVGLVTPSWYHVGMQYYKTHDADLQEELLESQAAFLNLTSESRTVTTSLADNKDMSA
jgi:hypothetical protein